MKLDLRTRCARCRKIPRGKNQKANWERYSPFCSYSCQEWFKLEEARKDLNAKRLLAAAPRKEGK